MQIGLRAKPTLAPPPTFFLWNRACIYSRSNDPNGKALLAHALSIQNWIPLYKMDDCSAMLDYFYCVVYNLSPRLLPSCTYHDQTPYRETLGK